MHRLPALELGERAARRRKAGVDMLDVVGVPILPMPEHVIAAATEAASRTYPRMSRGWPQLREAIASSLATTQGLRLDPATDVVVTHGAQHGMSVALRALLEPGDEVLVPSPTYFYSGMLRLAGLKAVTTPSIAEERWRHDIDAMAAAITPRTRAIVLCNPNNPTGYLGTREELSEILALAARHGLIVLSDESYERYVHDGEYVPLQSMRDAHDDVVTITSLSKNYAFTGWRVGYVAGPEHLVDAVHAALEWDSVNVGDAQQAAASAVITGAQGWIQPALDALLGKRDLLVDGLREAGVTVEAPGAGVFVLADLGASGATGRDLEDALLDQGLGALGGDVFLGPASHVRLLYGSSEATVAATAGAVGRAIRLARR